MIRLIASEAARKAARRARMLYAAAGLAWVVFAACVSIWAIGR